MTHPSSRRFAAILALFPALAGPAAFAHVTLEQPEAPAGSTYKAVLRIGHGCDGAATQVLRVSIPSGVSAVRPMPKPGWTLEVVTAPDAPERVTEIVWTGELPDAFYDEFVFRARLDAGLPAGGTVFFPTVQECAAAREAWVEIPAAGQDPHDLAGPAPGVRVLAGGGPAHGAPRAAEVRAGDLRLSGGFSRATPPAAKVGVGFLTIANAGATEDRLIGASSPVAQEVQVHETRAEGDVMTMRHRAEGLPVPAGGTVALAPGGLHLMLMGLRAPLKEGETVPVTLRFERGGEVTLPLAVRAATEGGAGSPHQH